MNKPNLAPYRKAVLATFVPFVGALGLAMIDGDLTRSETIAAAGIGLATGAGVRQITNKA
jgi:hypothetical protein